MQRHDVSQILTTMMKPKRDMHQQSLYLDPEKAEILDRLAAITRIPKAVLLREAVDDLLAKYRNHLEISEKIAKSRRRR